MLRDDANTISSLSLEKVSDSSSEIRHLSDCLAMLKDKSKVTTLELSWCGSLENVNPEYLRHIKKLKIDIMQRIPTWLHELPNLHTLELNQCSGGIPVNALTHIRTLQINNCSGVHSLPENMPVLESLSIQSMGATHDLLATANLSEVRRLSLIRCEFVKILDFATLVPKLQVLFLSGCKDLLRIESWPLHLRDIRIHECTSLSEMPHRNALLNLEILDVMDMDIELVPITRRPEGLVRFRREMSSDMPAYETQTKIVMLQQVLHRFGGFEGGAKEKIINFLRFPVQE